MMGLKAHKAILQNIHLPVLGDYSPIFHYSNISIFR
jgi:hypothetical protein